MKYNLRKGINCSKIVALHLDEINVQPRHLFQNKIYALRLLSNNPEALIKHVSIFNASINRRKKSINLCSKSTHDIKVE